MIKTLSKPAGELYTDDEIQQPMIEFMDKVTDDDLHPNSHEYQDLKVVACGTFGFREGWNAAIEAITKKEEF